MTRAIAPFWLTVAFAVAGCGQFTVRTHDAPPPPDYSVSDGRGVEQLRRDNAQLRAKMESLEARLKSSVAAVEAQQAQIRDLKRQCDDLKKERDRWKKAAKDRG